MNAKELRAAAEVAVMQWDNHDRHRLVAGDEVLLNSDGEPDEVTFARHILATVREDDDELWSADWAFSLFPESVSGDCDEEYLTLYLLGEHGVEWSLVVPVPKARGQFRSLCRGLGIELKEVDDAN